MKTITLNNVIELLEAAVNKKGREYVDPNARPEPGGSRCRYAADGAPSCIVGHVLVDLGVDPTDLETVDGAVGEIMDPDLEKYDLQEQVEITEPAIMVLEAAQAQQDRAESWGTALDVARKEQGRQLTRIKNVAGIRDVTAAEAEGDL